MYLGFKLFNNIKRFYIKLTRQNGLLQQKEYWGLRFL